MPHPNILSCSIDDWLFEQAIPLWIEHGVDRKRGGLFDALDPRTLENASPIKRLRVITRQIFVFSESALRNVVGAADAAAHGVDQLFSRFRSANGGFVSCCSLEGTIIDGTRDLYDLAFVLFALGSAYRLNPEPRIVEEINALLDFIDTHMRHSDGGFVEALPARLPRRQNPHMHLFEAALCCVESLHSERCLDLCHVLAELFRQRFFDERRAALYEYFDEELRIPVGGVDSALVEPGHYFEWAWLLDRYASLSGHVIDGGAALCRFALRHGVNPDNGLLYGELHADGRLAKADVRLWPHCEWLRATRLAHGAAGDSAPAIAALQKFILPTQRGCWSEYWDAEPKRFRDGPMPASSLYHLTTAIAAFTA